jgi:hypothetical protein
MIMQITKNDIGKNVWLVPTENNISRNGTSPLEQAKEAVITKMARTKGEFTFIGSKYGHSFSVNSNINNYINQGYNAGYVVYASLEDVENARKSQLVKNYLLDNLHSLPNNKLLKIGKVLNLDIQSKSK